MVKWFCNLPARLCTNSVLAAVVLYLCILKSPRGHPASRGCIVHQVKVAGAGHLWKSTAECWSCIDRGDILFSF